MRTPQEVVTRRVAVRTAAAVLVVVGLVALTLWPRGQSPPAGHDWTAEWRNEPPVVTTIPGGLLELSTMRMVEDFYKSDRKVWWGIYLGETVSHIQVPATYRYGVPLSDPLWQIVTRGQTCVVVAPSLRPSLPVAIDTAAMREKTESGWARFDKQANLDDLRRSISADLADRANDPSRMALAREASRKTVAEFVERWLVPRGEWQPGVFSSVKVFFADEVDDRMREQLGADSYEHGAAHR